MKKKITLLMLITISALSVYSQTLLNTTWAVYDTSSTFFMYFHFGTDTLSYSSDSVSYENVSIFQIDGNNFSIIDLPSGPCPASDTGTYNFLIQNDTLKFTLISDTCESRPITISNYHWIRLLQTGIPFTNQLPTIKIYPNPTSDLISIKSNHNTQGSTYIIFDQYGRQVLIGKLTGEITSVDIKQLPVGLYFLQIGEKNKQKLKIIKK